MRTVPIVILALLLVPRSVGAVEPIQLPVFVSDEGGYHTYRIPSVIVTTKGTLLAFCEGRKGGRGDAGDIDLLLKRSTDGGATWSKPLVVWDDAENTCGNPCPVVDARTGTIWLLLTHNLGTDSESAIVSNKSKASRTVWVTHSTDDGQTWTKPAEITPTVKKEGWTWYATGPGVGIQLKNGRLLIPCDSKSEEGKVRESHVIFSDDRGKTWKLGGVVGPNCNESQAVELADGSVMLNMRSYQANNRRLVAISKDGGETFSKPVEDKALVEPVCQASILRWPGEKGGILFSNPASTKREKLTVRLSRDEGKTWTVARELHSGPAAYSCLTVLPRGEIGCLYERGDKNPYETITFARFSREWLASTFEKPRLIVLTDIGGDPDDQQSMIRLMHYANEFDIEGLIASAAGTPGELKKETVRPELIREIVEAYGKVRPNLLLHRPDYPEARFLLDRMKSGNPVRGVKSLGEGFDTEGSRWIASVVDRDDPRPVNVAIWGGSTELAQALWRARKDRTSEQLKKFVGKLRVFSIGHQDDTGPWINENFPDLFFILSIAPKGQDMRKGAYRGMYLGGDESLTSRDWVDRYLRKEHGPLGALYPTSTWTAPNPHSTLKEGDTPSWFYFLPTGLGDPAHPEWGGWGGRFHKDKDGLYRDERDTVGGLTDARACVWRWRPAFQADFAARAEWCVKSVKEANHPPVLALNGDHTLAAVDLKAKAGGTVKLSAAGSFDPDNDRLVYRWFVYSEVGGYGKPVPLPETEDGTCIVTVPADSGGKTIHVILEVTDRGTPALTRYRRAVLTIGE